MKVLQKGYYAVLLVLFMLLPMSINATETKNVFTENLVVYAIDFDDELECTVTATVNIGGTGVTISSTKPTCAEAVADVAAGVKALLEQF